MTILLDFKRPKQNKADIVTTKSKSTKCSRRPDGPPCTPVGLLIFPTDSDLCPIWNTHSQPGGNCIKIGLPGKSILRDYFQDNDFQRRVL